MDDDRIDFSALASSPRELERFTANVLHRALEARPHPVAQALIGWRAWVLIGATVMAFAACLPAWLSDPLPSDPLTLEDSP